MLRASVRPTTPSRGLPRGGWLALGLSVGIHGLLLAALCCIPSGTIRADRSPPVVTAVVVSDEFGERPGRGAQAGPVEPEPPPPVIQLVPVADASSPGSDPGPIPPAAASAEPAGAGHGSDDHGGGLGSDTEHSSPTFFKVAAHGDSVVYVLDCSASMGLNDSFADARREVLASLDRLPESSRFQVICYNRDAMALNICGRTDLVPAGPQNKRAAAVVLEGKLPAADTNHLEALRQALALEPDVIFWVTDAADLKAEEVRTVTGWNHGRTAIHAIELSSRDPAGPDTPLSWLARYNRGTYKVVAPADAN
jgi:hypothetical protein